MKFKDIEPIQHPSYPLFDKQWKVEFENGNGLSVVNGNHAYCGSNTYEIAPLLMDTYFLKVLMLGEIKLKDMLRKTR